ncbi:hypothetical protein BpHYR1_016070 [Brachionus plicatilis]|uniref:Uncharacterized protein n=1 Tax=Brachionus plicatilis TaxID=10195 RepID=A0A3M7S9X2_BRAPC|nr:hypothetical protein BpHYR1_016070 [Brachionus plicatilis]
MKSCVSATTCGKQILHLISRLKQIMQKFLLRIFALIEYICVKNVKLNIGIAMYKDMSRICVYVTASLGYFVLKKNFQVSLLQKLVLKEKKRKYAEKNVQTC